MTHSDQINEIAAALVKAQAVIEGASKDKNNPHFNSKYADLSSVWEACRKPLSANGISVVQSPSMVEGKVCVTTMLLHTSGQWFRDELALTPDKATPQAVGSAITYARRYALAAFAGVAPEDDDGEAAEGRGNGAAKQKAAPAKPAGYDEWLQDMGSAADLGTDALRAAWTASKSEFRAYLGSSDGLKARAAKADKKKPEAVTA